MHHHDVIDVIVGAGYAGIKLFEFTGRFGKGNCFDPSHEVLSVIDVSDTSYQRNSDRARLGFLMAICSRFWLSAIKDKTTLSLFSVSKVHKALGV